MPTVELVSNISHYYYTALSLLRCGFLGHFITGPRALDNEQWMQRVYPFKRLWVERKLAEIPPAQVKRLWLPEIAQKMTKRLGGTSERCNWIHNELFAREAALRIDQADAVHFVSSVGLEAARKAKKNSALCICDIRMEHPVFQEEILSEEGAKLGVDAVVPGSSYRQRILAELEIADYVVCPSSYAKRTFVDRGMDARRIVVCPYGVDTEAFRPGKRSAKEDPQAEFVVLFLGNICIRKGVHYLLEGFKRAALKNSRLILAGPVDRSFRAILQSYDGLYDAVGPVPKLQVPRYYQQAHVFVLPSLADAYPLVAMEAMGSGIPLIVSENTGTADVVRENGTGFVVPIRDADSIAERLTSLHADRERCIEIGERGCHAKERLSWTHYEESLAGFYKNLFAAA
jgi:glycosyltransferase involved in cell wall biosynthesis